MENHNVFIELPEDVANIIRKLENAGFEAYAVGGCIRDSLLKREPEDWDITTSALPEQIKELFRRTVDTGIKHGTVTVLIGKNGYEITTFRIDSEYEDGRHPKSVEFSNNLTEDLQRRDFTINAMAYNGNAGLIDTFNGIEDLRNKIVRCVGDPTDRFSEDALRMMRAIRFSAQLGFDIESKTFEAIRLLAANINKVSRERIHVELNKTLMSEHPEYIMQMYETGLTREAIPLVDSILSAKRSRTTLALLRAEEKLLVLRYAGLLNEASPKDAKETLRALKLDGYTIGIVPKLIENSKLTIEENEAAVRKALYKYGEELFRLILMHQEAIIVAKEEMTGIIIPGAKKHIAVIRRLLSEIIERGDCIAVKDLAVNGNDLMEYGMKGQQIGETLEELLHIVMENPKLNERETLIAMIENR